MTIGEGGGPEGQEGAEEGQRVEEEEEGQFCMTLLCARSGDRLT